MYPPFPPQERSSDPPRRSSGLSSTLNLPSPHPTPHLACVPQDQISSGPNDLLQKSDFRISAGVSPAAEMGLESGAGRAGQSSPELVCPGRTSPRWSQVDSVVPDPHAERDARIPPLLRVVPRYKAASPPSQSSQETNWREGTVQWGADSSPLDTELVSLHPPPHLFIYGPSP